MTAARKGVTSACVVCGRRANVELHHLGGRRHLIWLTAPLCRVHHDQLHRVLKTADVDLEYTADPVERLIRASKAISIFMCMVLDALHQARSLQTTSGGEERAGAQDIFVRAHAPLPPKEPWRGHARKWPDFALIFDTETKTDPTQKLTFGCFRRYELKRAGYSCVEEGLFFADHLRSKDRRVLDRYVGNPLNVPETEIFPPQLRLKLMSRNAFVRGVFWGAIRRGDLIVGFNLPFDLSRLAVKFTDARKGGWSLALTLRESKKTGDTEIDIERPRIVVTSINSKMAFFKLSSKWAEEWPNEPRFLDLRTLAFALRNVAYSLSSACKAFGVKGKDEPQAYGKSHAQGN